MPEDNILSIPLVIRIKIPGENYFVAIPVTNDKLVEKIYRGRATVRDIRAYLESAKNILPETDKVKLENVLQTINDWESSNMNWQAVIVSEGSGGDLRELATYTPDDSIPEVHIVRKTTEEGLEINAIDLVFSPVTHGGGSIEAFFMNQ